MLEAVRFRPTTSLDKKKEELMSFWTYVIYGSAVLVLLIVGIFLPVRRERHRGGKATVALIESLVQIILSCGLIGSWVWFSGSDRTISPFWQGVLSAILLFGLYHFGTTILYQIANSWYWYCAKAYNSSEPLTGVALRRMNERWMWREFWLSPRVARAYDSEAPHQTWGKEEKKGEPE